MPLGRETESLEERQLARNILERNEASIQDLLDEDDINVRTQIPFRDLAGVLCPENGDLLVLSGYIGYDKIYICCTEDRVEEKEAWVKLVPKVFKHIAEGELDKIEVKGF